MRLGGPVFTQAADPQAWAAEHQRKGYRAAYCPVGHEQGDAAALAYARAAHEADLIIAEVGAWSNPLSPDEATRRQAIAHCQAQLALADRIGALCCVNISGSRGAQWDGPHPDNLTLDTHDLIVETVRHIIDAVKPTRAFYTLETMPWMYPDSADSYLKLLDDIDRKHFAAHLDPVNLVCSPQRYFLNGALIRECFQKLGGHIKSCHAKDITLSGKLTVHLDETRPGTGGLDYEAFLTELASHAPDAPLMLEHLPSEADYDLAAAHVRAVAARAGVALT
jgi:sugar phosphate isomerase/epimerase